MVTTERLKVIAAGNGGVCAKETTSMATELLARREAERWRAVAEELPEPYVTVMLQFVKPDQDLADYNPRIGVGCGHLETNGNGEIITRPLCAPGATTSQWPAWSVADDDDNYHKASHWRPLPQPPAEEGEQK